MGNLVKKFITPLVPQQVLNITRKYIGQKELKAWEKNGRPTPPPHIVKQLAIRDYQQQHGHRILVETGTYRGDMVEAQRNRFKKIFSIELGVDLFHKAQKRFRNHPNVEIVQGDSGKVLSKIMKEVQEPAIFWLDGHYSAGVTAKGDKDCPIFEEVDAIFNSTPHNHILLIDDARCFVGKDDYPTIDHLTEYIRQRNDRYQVEVKDDIIRYVIS